MPALYNALTPAIVQEAAKTYLNTNNYVEVTLFPEKKTQAPGARPQAPGSQLQLSLGPSA